MFTEFLSLSPLYVETLGSDYIEYFRLVFLPKGKNCGHIFRTKLLPLGTIFHYLHFCF